MIIYVLTRISLHIRLALTSVNKYQEAVTSYQKALDLDPENDSYKSNLKIAEQKLRDVSSPVSLLSKSIYNSFNWDFVGNLASIAICL